VLLDGGAALLLGGTGAGKSTLVFAARSDGRGVLADDIVAVRAGAAGPEAIGIPRPLALSTAGPDGLPSGARAIGLDGRDRWQFPLDGVPGAHSVSTVLLVEHSTRPEGSVEPLGPSEVFDALMGSYLAATDPGRLRSGLPVLAALSRLPGWRLGHGADPDTRLRVGARLLDSVAASCRD
jgi:hypothetical protein